LLQGLVGLLSETFLTTLRSACRAVDATLRNGCDPEAASVWRPGVPNLSDVVTLRLADVVVIAAF